MKRGGNKMNFTIEKLDKHYFSQVIKVNVNSDVMLIACIISMIEST